MRSSVCHFLIFFLLYVSVEAAADVVEDVLPHGDPAAHLVEFGHALDTHGGIPADELDGGHCKHCCHGHAASIAAAPGSAVAIPGDDSRIPGLAVMVPRYSRTPPVPPPNA